MFEALKKCTGTLNDVLENVYKGKMSFGTITLENKEGADILITIKAETMPEKLPEVPKG